MQASRVPVLKGFIIATLALSVSAARVPGLMAQSPSRPSTIPQLPAPSAPVRIDRDQNGSMQTNLGYGIVLNRNSSLTREAITIHDSRLPVALPASVVVQTVYDEREYKYRSSITVTPTETLMAIEVRVLLFDVFGEPIRTLSMTEVADMRVGASAKFDPEWRVWTENEASSYYASITFVARVRTASGRVVEADLAPVLAEARRFNRRLTNDDLAPSNERREPPRGD